MRRKILKKIFHFILRVTGNDAAKLIDKPDGKKILVLAPHIDDDVIGCGGTLIKHHLAGDDTTCVYMTDGRKGDPTFSSEEMLIQERKREAKEAAKIIEIKNLIFLKNEDLKLKVSKKTISEIKDILEEVNPDVVYVPYFLDEHRDHIATAKIFAMACRRNNQKYGCYMYEVWRPIVFNRIVDISKAIDRKLDGIRKYKSQLKHVDYENAVRGLNKYRAITTGLTGFAEVFFYCSVKEYIKLMGYFKLS